MWDIQLGLENGGELGVRGWDSFRMNMSEHQWWAGAEHGIQSLPAWAGLIFGGEGQ